MEHLQQWRRMLVVWAMTGTMGIFCSAASADAPSRVLPDLVKPSTVKMIDRAMNYLSKTQRRDGSWMNNGGYGGYPAVMSSLAGLAMMSGGSTAENGPHHKEVRRAMTFILRLAENNPDGLICQTGGQTMYAHGFSLLFLANCYGVDGSPEYEARLKKALDKAVAVVGKSQSDKGGWYYTPGSNSDEGSVTVTQLQALRACRNVGIKVPKRVISKAVDYLKLCQNGDGGISYSASSRGSSRPAISAAAIACFYSAGIYDRTSGGSGEEAKMVERLVRYVQGACPVNGGSGFYFYQNLYLAQAMYMRGGADWKNFYPAMCQQLETMQSSDGSWNGDSNGTTYGTAIAGIILQLPYGYLPIVQR